MLLVNSLKEKVDDINDKISLNKSRSRPHYHKKTKKIESKLLFLSKSNDRFFAAAEEGLLSNEDIIKRYTKERLHKCWKEKVPVNFNMNHKKFSDDIMTKNVKEAKAYVTNLVDPNRFENNQPKWDISTKADEIKPPLLKQSLFLINNQLNQWGAVPIKIPHIEEGVDSSYKNSDKPQQWNESTQLTQQERDTLHRKSIKNDENNTANYWMKNDSNRKTKKQFRISEERKRIESPRYYKQYHNPTIQIKKDYELINKIKQDLWLEREKIRNEVIHNNPGDRNVDEKINALVEKKMYKTYKEKFRIATGKQKENKANDYKKHVYHWNDGNLIDKIHTITNWKDITWFKSKYSTHEMDEVLRQKLLQILMIRGSEIQNEQEVLQEMRIKGKHKKREKGEYKRCQSSIGISIKMNKHSNLMLKQDINKENDLNKEIDFIEAYKKFAINDIEKLKEEKKSLRPKSCIDYSTYHPGVYVRLYILIMIENFCSQKESAKERRRKKFI